MQKRYNGSVEKTRTDAAGMDERPEERVKSNQSVPSQYEA